MKKLYLMLLFISFGAFSKNVTITKVIETGCSNPFVKTVELYVDGTVDFANDDDGYQIVIDGIVVSQFGKTETDGTDEEWEHVDAVATRLDGIPDSGTFDVSHWSLFSIPHFRTKSI